LKPNFSSGNFIRGLPPRGWVQWTALVRFHVAPEEKFYSYINCSLSWMVFSMLWILRSQLWSTNEL